MTQRSLRSSKLVNENINHNGSESELTANERNKSKKAEKVTKSKKNKENEQVEMKKNLSAAKENYSSTLDGLVVSENNPTSSKRCDSQSKSQPSKITITKTKKKTTTEQEDLTVSASASSTLISEESVTIFKKMLSELKKGKFFINNNIDVFLYSYLF